MKPNLLLNSETDRLFATDRFPDPFAFNQEVASVFDDMISRSVPLYQEAIAALISWIERLYQDGTQIYDLGCSTGSTLHAICSALPKITSLVGIDPSAPMLQKAELKLHTHKERVTFQQTDALSCELRNPSVVVLNYTLQFIPVEQRLQLLKKIKSALIPGGMLFLSEKLKDATPAFQEITTDIYESFKSASGYSQTEIAKKRKALEGVLIPLSWEEQMDLLKAAGFQHIYVPIKWHQFTSLVAM